MAQRRQTKTGRPTYRQTERQTKGQTDRRRTDRQAEQLLTISSQHVWHFSRLLRFILRQIKVYTKTIVSAPHPEYFAVIQQVSNTLDSCLSGCLSVSLSLSLFIYYLSLYIHIYIAYIHLSIESIHPSIYLSVDTMPRRPNNDVIDFSFPVSNPLRYCLRCFCWSNRKSIWYFIENTPWTKHRGNECHTAWKRYVDEKQLTTTTFREHCVTKTKGKLNENEQDHSHNTIP